MPSNINYNPSLPAERPPPGRSAQRPALLLTLGFLILGWVVAYVLTIWSLRQTALENGLTEAAAYARNFERHLTQTLEIVDLAALSLAPDGSSDTIDTRFSGHLTLLLNQAPYLRSLSLIGADNRVLTSSTAKNIGLVVENTGLYPEASSDQALLRIGTPWRGRDLYNAERPDSAQPLLSKDAFFLPIMRQTPGTGRVQAVVAAINPDYFLTHFVQIMPSTEGFVQLLRHDGRLLLSSRHNDDHAASRPSGIVHDHLANSDFGELTQNLGGQFDALTAYRASSKYPFVVVVHADENRVLQRWQQDTRRISLIVFPVLLALTAAILLIWRRQKRLEAKERELLEQRLLAASLFEASTDAVLITTPGGQIIAANPAFERMCGYSATEVLGRNPRLLSSGLHDQDFYQTLWEDVLISGHWQGEIINRHKDGHLFHNLLTINAVRGTAGKISHLIGVAADITRLKAHEAELQTARDRAESASQAKSVFLGTMSHELRTPMHGVLGMTEVLLRSQLSERQTYQLGIIRSSAERLLGILEQLLDYTHLESHGITLERSRFDLRGLFDELYLAFNASAQRKSLGMACRIAPNVPDSIVGDRIRLHQAINHLLSNALKFTEQGSISLLAEIDADGRLRISVTDTGIGIAPERQLHIFEAFTQVDSSPSRRFGGLGLGLAISRRLAVAMGGELSVQSQPETGSCFTLLIPVK